MMRLYDAQNNDDDEESIVRRIWTYIRMKESFDVKNFLDELRTRKPNQKTKKVSLTNRIDSVISKLTASTDQNNNNNNSINQNEDPIVVLMDTSDCDDISIDIDSKAINAKINHEDEDEDESDDDDNNNLLPMTTRDIDFEFKKNWCNAKRGKREPNWEIMWRSLTETLNELRNNNDEIYLEYYTLILKLHVQHKVKLSYKCNESLLNCLEPSYISSLFDLKLIDPQEFTYIYSIYEKNFLFSIFKANSFESSSLHPFFLIMSYSVFLYKTKCKPYRKQILNAIQKELAVMINLNLFDEKFKKIGVKCFLKAIILNGLFDRESLNTFLEFTDKSSNSFNIRMIRNNHGHHHFHHHDDDSDEFDEEDEDEDSEMDDESENFDEDEEIDHDDEEDEDDFFNSDSDEVDNDALLAQQAVIRQNIEQAPNNYAPRSPSQPPPPQLPALPVPPERAQVLGRRMPVERRVEPAAPAVEPPIAPPKKKSVADYIDTNNDLRNIFPLSLKNLARIKIKNSMNVYDECNVLKLKVQNVLCKFILFQDEIDSIVKSVNQAKAPKPVASTNSNIGTNNANNN